MTRPSQRKLFPPLASLAEAVASFTPAMFVRTLRVGEPLLWESSHLAYALGPRLDEDEVSAILADPRPGYGPAAEVKLLSLSPSLQAVCTRVGHNRTHCEHIRRLLADLALCPELRRAVAAGEPVEPALAIVAQLRLQKQEEVVISSTLDRWAPPRVAAEGVTLEVGVEEDFDFGGRASLSLIFRASPARRILTISDLDALRCSPDMRRLITLCEGSYTSRRGVVALNRFSGSVLEILRAHPEWEVQGAPFADTPLRMFVARERHASLQTMDMSYLPRAVRPKREPDPIDVLEARWKSADGSIELRFEDVRIFPGSASFVRRRDGGPFFPVDPSVDMAVALRAMQGPALAIPKGLDAALLRQLRARLFGRGVVLPSRASMGLPELAAPDFTVRIDGHPLGFDAILEAVYSGQPVPIAGDGEDLGTPGDGARDDDSETAAASRLLSAGLVWDRATRRFRAADEDAAASFWRSGVEALRADMAPKLEVFLSDRLAGVRVRGAVKSRLQASLVDGWLETQVSFEADEIAAEMDALREALARRRKWVLLRDGSLARLTRETADFAGAVDVLFSGSPEGRLSVAQVGLLDHWAAEAAGVEVDARVEQLRSRLRALDVRPAERPADLRATLRPYQLQGLAWLQFLDELGTGGILADDMGLGKTLMTLAFLARAKESKGQAPSLVVCPTSVVGNWLREAARFTPGLSVVSLAGSDRAKRLSNVPESDLVVTTYALMRLDEEQLQGFEFRTIIFDEAQNVKNAAAATRQAAARLRAGQKLALTGTPVENRLGELWSILDICNPGMLGSERSFQARFERPIANEPGCAAAGELRARVRPFVLRRSKAQVLLDLPPKEEIDISCIPGAAQRRAYDVLADMMRRDVESAIAARGFAQSGILVLTALLRLRQMCCDPRLVDASRPASEGAKREAFLSLVRDLVAEGRRALVFSQFVELLRLWRADLDREGIEYEYLDGSTKDRDEIVSRFQAGRASLFLLSLKAGGAGLNLTAADTVIHCDPWWNPAVEAQATDRTHRIGQSRPVTVYRLVLAGSIEEKIVELKARKRAIADAIVREDAGEMRGLSQEDVQRLLSGVEGGDIDVVDADVRDDGAAPEEAPSERKRGPRPQPSGGDAAPPRSPGPASAAAQNVVARERGLDRDAVAPAESEPLAGLVDGEALDKLVRDIRHHLRAAALTQRSFAAMVGISEVTLSRLLTGSLLRINRASASKLSRALSRE